MLGFLIDYISVSPRRETGDRVSPHILQHIRRVLVIPPVRLAREDPRLRKLDRPVGTVFDRVGLLEAAKGSEADGLRAEGGYCWGGEEGGGEGVVLLGGEGGKHWGCEGGEGGG